MNNKNRKSKRMEDYVSLSLAKKIVKGELSSVERKKAISILEERGDIKLVNFDKLITHTPGNIVTFTPAKNASKLDKSKTFKGTILKAWADHKRGAEWLVIKVLETGFICTKKGENVQLATS